MSNKYFYIPVLMLVLWSSMLMSTQYPREVLLELSTKHCDTSLDVDLKEMIANEDALQLSGFVVDEQYDPVCMSSNDTDEVSSNNSIIIKGRVENAVVEKKLLELESVLFIWADSAIAPFKEDKE